jgi:hypothetical protein
MSFKVGDRVAVKNYEDADDIKGYVGTVVDVDDAEQWPIEVVFDEVDDKARLMNVAGWGSCPFSPDELELLDA